MRGNQAIGLITQRGDDRPRQRRHGAARSAARTAACASSARIAANIAYELHVESNGPDEATALDCVQDRPGSSVDDLGVEPGAQRVTSPPRAPSGRALTLRVPASAGARDHGGSGGADVAEVAAVDLDRASGDVTLTDIAGAVTGTHRNGELTRDRRRRGRPDAASSRARRSRDVARERHAERSQRPSARSRTSRGAVEIDDDERGDRRSTARRADARHRRRRPRHDRASAEGSRKSTCAARKSKSRSTHRSR